MKKLVLAVLLSLAVLPAFSQDNQPPDPYAPFQGVWYNIGDIGFTHYIFNGNTLTIIIKEFNDIFIATGNYTLKNNLVVFICQEVFSDSGWLKVPSMDSMGESQYVFSGDRLVIISDGDPISLKKVE
jgi:hypothetical protein